MEKMTILIVTSGQPSANPRVVKEAIALDAAGHSVTVVFAPLSPWADRFDEELFARTPGIKWIPAGYHPLRNPWLYKFARVRRKLYEWLAVHTSFLKAGEKAYILYAQELSAAAARIKADLYIGHNLGALPAAVKAARKWKTKCGFDAEDFHRGESAPSSLAYSLAAAIENKNIPALDYMSAASPLIAEEYESIFPGRKVLTINNVFSRKYLQHIQPHAMTGLHLFWFSQTVGPERGLETVIEAINSLGEGKIHLHLLGNCSDTYRAELTGKMSDPASLHFIGPVPQESIFEIASGFDIGLATEVPYCRNRDICLTNKLFSYLLSGNAIIASDTLGQKKFLAEHKDIGLLYRDGDAGDLASCLKRLYEDRALLEEFRGNSLALADGMMNWEKESEKLISHIAGLLNEKRN